MVATAYLPKIIWRISTMMNISFTRFDSNYNYVLGYNAWKVHSSKLDATKETLTTISALFSIYRTEISLSEFTLFVQLIIKNHGKGLNNVQLTLNFPDNTINSIENLQNSLLFYSLSKSLKTMTTSRSFSWFRNKLSLLPETAQNLYNNIEVFLTKCESEHSRISNRITEYEQEKSSKKTYQQDIVEILDSKKRLTIALEDLKSENVDYTVVGKLCDAVTKAEDRLYKAQKDFIRKHQLPGF
jgi:hypothetical protein